MSAIAGWAARHARAVLAISALLAIGAGALATGLPSDASPATLVDSDTPSYRATQHLREVFGEEPVVIAAEGNLQRLVLTANLARLLRLEGCLAGKVPRGATPIPGPCAELAALRPVQFLAGPATFLNEAVIGIEEQLRLLAARMTPGEFRRYLLAVAARYGVTSVPSIANPSFVADVVFDLRRGSDTPKSRLAYLFPNGHSAQIVLRLRASLSEAERHRALGLISEAVHDTTPRRVCAFEGRPAPCFALHGGRYLISGVPVVVDGLTGDLKDALLVLFAASIVVMALCLLAVFRSRLRLLPLAIALAAAALTFGLLEVLGGSLTMASIAVLPILIGLAVDYAIQLQARYDEAVEGGARGEQAARLAAAQGVPTIATACLATAAGFCALQLSPTPMVRSFGLLLVAGVAIAFAVSLSAGFAALSLRGARRRTPTPLNRLRERAAGRIGLFGRRLLAFSLGNPRRILVVGLALAALGLALGTQVETVSDIRALAPQSLPAVRDLIALQDATGVSGELEVSIQAADLADPATIRWMAAFKRRVLRSSGFEGSEPSCEAAEICPGPALSDFLAAGKLSARGIRETLAQLSPYDLEGVAPLDPMSGRLGHTALISFGIRSGSLAAQQTLIDRVRSEIGSPGTPGGPPPGVRVRLAGLPVIAAQAAADLSSSRYWLTLAGLAAVALVLGAVYRSPARALVPLVPTVLASGWSGTWCSGSAASRSTPCPRPWGR